MLKCIIKKNGLVFVQKVDTDNFDLKSLDDYMNLLSENHVLLIKDEDCLYELFPNFKEISRTDEGFVIKE